MKSAAISQKKLMKLNPLEIVATFIESIQDMNKTAMLFGEKTEESDEIEKFIDEEKGKKFCKIKNEF